jgi:hypothetical protein
MRHRQYWTRWRLTSFVPVYIGGMMMNNISLMVTGCMSSELWAATRPTKHSRKKRKKIKKKKPTTTA